MLYGSLSGLVGFIEKRHEVPSIVFTTAIAARVAVVFFVLLVFVLFVFRLRPLAKARGVGVRVVALAGTFLPTSLGLLPRYEDSALLNLASFTCLAIGNALAIYGFTYLSHSSSIMAEARRLVTNGPYRIMRHPVYAFEEIAVIGYALNYLWPSRVAAFALLILVSHAWCQLRRMRAEEDVLQAAFPEYGEYKQHTARLVPGIY